MYSKTTVAAVLCLATLAARTASAQEEWSYEMVPFLWGAGIDGRAGVDGATASVDASFQDLLEFVDLGVALRVSAQRPPILWFIEGSYVGLEGDAAAGAARVESTQIFGELGLGYQFNSALTLYGGLRGQQINSTIEFAARRGEGEESWLDGILGVRWTPLVSDHWMAWVRGDAGAGGSNLVWLAEAGGGYRWTQRWAAYLAYRVLDTDYDHDGFVYDIQQSGLLIGFGARF